MPEDAFFAPRGLFRHNTTIANGVRLHYVVGGTGFPLVLLHGFPQTWRSWRVVAPALAEKFTVVMPDLRGLGDSEILASGYDKRNAAEDIFQLMRGLGFDAFHVAGHDIGALVAYALAAAHPDAVRRLAILDQLIAGFGLEEAVMDCSQAGRGFWHFPFHMARDIPEALVEGKEGLYVRWHHECYGFQIGRFATEDVEEYVRCYSRPGAMRAGFAYYRALFDDAVYNRAQSENGLKKLKMPVLALGGEHGAGAWTRESVQKVADDVRGGVVANAGHFLAEENPDEIAAQFLAFFGE